MLSALRRVAASPEAFPQSRVSIAETTARLVGVRALLPLEKLIVDGGLAGRAAAVPGLGYVQHPRAVELLVLAYGKLPMRLAPGEGAAPSGTARTGAAAMEPDLPERTDLFDATRRLERYLCTLLAGAEAESAHHAYELLDRASRFGALVDPGEVTAALERFRARGDRRISSADVDSTIARLAARR
jgi:hypothetical protein